MATKAVNPIDEVSIKNVIFPMWKKAVADRRKYDDTVYAQYKTKGEKELARLVAAFQNGGVDGYLSAIKGYEWVAEKIDTVVSPWVIAGKYASGIKKVDDCDGSMILSKYVILNSRMWLGCSMKNGIPQNFDVWHWILEIPSDGVVVSNFRGYTSTDAGKWMKNYNSKFNLIVEALPDFKGVGEIRAI